MKLARIGHLLKLWRATRNIEQRALASEIGMNASTLCRLEAGKTVDQATTIRVIDWIFGEAP